MVRCRDVAGLHSLTHSAAKLAVRPVHLRWLVRGEFSKRREAYQLPRFDTWAPGPVPGSGACQGGAH